MKDSTLRKGGLWPRLWLTGAVLALAAVLGHFEHAARQGEFLGEATLLGAFFSLFLPWMFPRNPKKLLRVTAAIVTALAVVLPVAATLTAAGLSRWEETTLRCETPERPELFAGHTVLVLVPHEDDELLMLGGVIEEYAEAGSRVILTYTTNGDHFGQGEKRLRESLRLAEELGIPESDVVFLGFGDGWQDTAAISMAAGDEVLTSARGSTAAAALSDHPALREGIAFTRNNYKACLRELLERERPDVIFCIDTDEQYEHRTLSVLFEETMGELLREEPEYTPTVYKCFAYASSWWGESFAENTIASLQYPERMEDNAQYLSAAGKRFPVDGDSVSVLSPELTALAGQLRVYASQDAVLRADSVMRGDRVGFLRRTDSLLRDAAVTVSSGDGAALTDFVISDPGQTMTALSPEMSENGWAPADESKTARFTFPEERELSSLVFYDSPSSQDNILSLTVTLSDGTELGLTELDPNGAPTELIFPETHTVDGFTVQITEAEGTGKLAEVEAFAAEAPRTPLVKLTDGEGDFAYELLTPASGQTELGVFVQDIAPGALSFVCDNPSVTLRQQGNTLSVVCPAGETGRITLLNEAGEALDVCSVTNPEGILRTLAENADTLTHLTLHYQWDYYRSMLHRIAMYGKV